MRDTIKLRKNEHNYYLRSSITSKHLKTSRKKNTGNSEFTKCVKKALKEAISENDLLRTQIISLNQQKIGLKVELEHIISALTELGNYYKYCKANHSIKNIKKLKAIKAKRRNTY